MKILVISQYYDPEPFRITDICKELANRGHEVTVVTGVPNYPEGVTYPGYEKGNRQDEVVDGVRIHRCFTIPRKSGAIFRLLNYFSYAISASLYVRKLPGDFDVVFVNQLSPVMMAWAGMAYSRKHGTPLLMYCLDLWPESLTAGGIQRDSFLFRIFHRISRKIYTRMDKILVTSRMFTNYLWEQFGIVKEKMAYLPQYAEAMFDRIPEVRKEEGWHVTLAGNLGEVQSVQTVLEAAALLKEEPVTFHIVGGGSDLERLQQLAKDLPNVVFYGRRPLEEMPVFYAKADAMLVTLKADPVLSLTLPGKVQSYMAAGKPIIGAIDGETATVIEEAGCGFCGRAEDAQALAENIRRFISCDCKAQLGQKGRTYYEKWFDKKLFMDSLDQEMKALL